MRLAIAAVTAAAVLPAACAPNPATLPTARLDGRQCFYADRISGFTPVSDEVIHVRVGVGEVYRFQLFGACPDVDWATRLGVISHGSSWICSGLDATVLAPSAVGPQHCPVRSIVKLSPAEIALLPPPLRP